MRNICLLIICFLMPLIGKAQLNEGTLICDEETYQLLKRLSLSSLKKEEIFLFTTTHQDLGWLDYIENCAIHRDTVWLTPFLTRLAEEPDFKMDIEQTSIVMEYIHRHPDKKELINSYLKEGRICVGGTFIQPYEEMYSGEALARQFYLGNRWMKEHFDGYEPLSYFNVDVPGRTLQMPQIMKKAGIDNLIISRHERGLFNWEAPDGSRVRAYTPGHYIYFYDLLGLEDEEAIKELAKEAELWYTQYNNIPKSKTVMPAMLNYEFIWDQRNVENCIPFTEKWNSITHIQTVDKKKMKVSLPKFRYAIADEFFQVLDQSTKDIPIIKGERPNVWLYIHGPSHEKALTASRKGDVLLPAVEKLSSFQALVNNNYNDYPIRRLNEAWKAKIYPDHGWGGKGGIETDNKFRRKFEFALSESEAMLEKGTDRLASHIVTHTEAGKPIVVFNTLSWRREDPVAVTIQLEKGYSENILLKNANGENVLSQLTEIEWYADGTISSAILHFIARDIPALGYQTYYLHPAIPFTALEDDVSKDFIDTEFYYIQLENGGIKQIVDKKLNAELLNTTKFKGGEIITMRSIGNGAGEFDAIQQPDMDDFDQVSSHNPSWELMEKGDVFTSFKYRSKIRHAVIEQTIRVYQSIPKIDFDVALLNWEGVIYREYRMMLPLAIEDAKVSYEVPFGIVTVGKDEMPGAAGERYYVENKKQHPRGIGNWIAAAGKEFTVTLSSSVAVADYLDPTDDPVKNTILQPILLASRRSCHGEGNDYLQTGDHYYHFSLTSHQPGDLRDCRFGISSNEKLKAVFAPKPYREASLPLTMSFMDIANENVIVSTIKKCEDDESLIVRLYNLSDQQQIVTPIYYRKPKQIIQVNLIEEEITLVEKMIIEAYGIETFKLGY